MKKDKQKFNNTNIPEGESFRTNHDDHEALNPSRNVLSILSQSHLILPQIDDESVLLNAICRDVAGQDKYQLCWLGLFNNSGENHLEPLIQNGFIPEEFERFRKARGSLLNDLKNVAGRFNQGASFEIKSMADQITDKKFKRHAIKFGYKSVLILPLREKSKLLGLLSVYSADQDSFQETEIQIFQNLAGNISFALISLRAKDQLKKAQEDLRESQQMLQLVMDTIPIRLFWKDRNFRYLGCNKAFALDAGLESPDDILGKNDFELSWKESAPLYRSDDREIIEKRISKINYEEPQVRVDGTRLWLRTSKIPLEDKDGEIIGLFGSYEDITERKHAEEALWESERRYKMATTAANVGVWDWDIQSQSLFIDPILKALLGYDDHEIENTIESWKNHIYPEDIKPIQSRVENYLEGKSDSFEMTYRMIHHDGHVKCFQARGIYLKNAEGIPYRMLGTNTDITLQMEMQREQEQMRAQLLQAQKMEAVGTLAGGMAHDFNNLLTSIKGYSDLSLMNLQDSDMIERNLKQIQRAVQRAGSLTNQLLLFSRKQMMAPASITINETITNMLMMLERVIGEDIRIHTDLFPGLWKVWADEGHIEQVIMNLAVNSRDAMPQGGTITIRTVNMTFTENESREPSKSRPGEFVELTFQDTGTGIDQSIQGHIFEPFFTTKEAGKGTGLGLSVIYGIISQHDGWIDVNSNPGEGATFRIYIPASFVKSSDENLEKLSIQEYVGHGETLLLVEDEQEIRELIEQALTQHGYQVLASQSAAGAWGIFKENRHRIKLVFSDVVLPDQNGMELVDNLLKENPELAVILTSGYTGERSNWGKIQRKRYHFLKKPFAISELLYVIYQGLKNK